jgi:predicted Asp-tRNA(Asn)/Glu-tRNA(Gln) amidotransferase subunit C
MEIEKEAEKVLKELSLALGEIDLQETYYVVEEINVTRGDGEPRDDNPKFKRIIKKNAPRMDEDGAFIMEAGRWVE